MTVDKISTGLVALSVDGLSVTITFTFPNEAEAEAVYEEFQRGLTAGQITMNFDEFTEQKRPQ